MRKARMRMWVGAIWLGLAACGNDPLAPFQPEVSNLPDNFQFQATGLTGVTTTIEYLWQDSGTSANVNQASAITGGSATVTIFDASSPTRVQVYSRSLADNGTFVTSTGTTGTWLIRVTLNNVSGTLNFRAQKP